MYHSISRVVAINETPVLLILSHLMLTGAYEKVDAPSQRRRRFREGKALVRVPQLDVEEQEPEPSSV